MTSAGGLVPVADAAAAPGRVCCCRDRRAGCGPAADVRGGVRLSRTRWRSTWAARAPTCASCAAACPNRRRSARSAASRSGCRRSTSTRSARAAARSRASTRAARSWSVRESAGADARARVLRARRHRSRRSPTPTSCSAASTADATFPGLGRLDVAAAREALAARRRGRGRRRRGRRRGDGAGGAGGHGRARRRSARARADRVRRRGPAARVRDRGRARHGRGHRAAARGRGVGRRAALLAPSARRSCAVASSASRRRRVASARARSRRTEAQRLVGAEATIETAVDCRYVGQSHEITVPTSTTSRPSTNVATVTRGRARRSRSSRCGREPPPMRRSGRPTFPARRAGARVAARRASPRPTARCGSPKAGSRSRARSVRGCSPAPEPEAMNIGRQRRRRAPGPDLAAHGRRRGDGCRAAARRVQPEHQGAGRLLGRAVHRRRHAARAGRAHPGAPRFDAGGGARGDRRVRVAVAARRPGHRQRPVRGWHAPQRRHARRARVRGRRRAGRVGRQPRAPRRPRRHGARLDAARGDGDLPGGAAAAAGVVHARGRGDLRRRRRARRRNGAAISTRSAVRTGSASTRLRELGGAPFAEVVAYGERRMRAALQRCPDGATSSRTCSTRPAGPSPIATAGARSRCRRSHGRGRRDHVRLHRYRRAASGHGQRGRSGDGQRGRVRHPQRHRSDDPGERRRAATRARARTVRARSSPLARPSRSARATSR